MVRVTHWINALVLLVLLMSGLQIFNAHPALYLGQASEFDDPLVAMEAVRNEDGLKGITTVFGWDFIDTTGVLGLGGDAVQGYQERGFPWWATLPGDRNVSHGPALAFLLRLAVPLQWGPAHSPLEPWKRAFAARSGALRARAQAYRRLHLGSCAAEISERRGGQALQCSPKARISRRGVDPFAANAAERASLCRPAWTRLSLSSSICSGVGRAARTIHFVSASLVVLFVVVHIVMVLISGVWNNLRSMITGRYVIEPAEEKP